MLTMGTVALADWWSYSFNKILDAVGDGVLTHENPMGKEAVEESRLVQLFVMKCAALPCRFHCRWW